MRLTDTDIQEFQTIVKEDYGLDIGWDEAYKNAHKLINLMEIILEPDDLEGGDANVKNN